MSPRQLWLAIIALGQISLCALAGVAEASQSAMAKGRWKVETPRSAHSHDVPRSCLGAAGRC
eukprot:6089850-Alexandrium_andersonii.AAC.1